MRMVRLNLTRFPSLETINWQRTLTVNKPAALCKPLALPIVAMLLLPMPCHAERAESVQYIPVAGREAGIGPASSFLGNGHRPWDIHLPTAKADLGSPGGGVAKSGVVIPLPAPVTASELSWEPVPGGYAARVHLSAGQAKRLRFHLSIPHGLKAVGFRAQGNLDSSPIGPVDGAGIQGGGVWLPVTNGNEADLEIFAGGADPPGALDFNIDSANVIVADPGSGDITGIVAQSLGYARYKEYDLACWSGDPSYPGLSQAAAATAKVNFIQNGGSFVCSGTLINDKGNTKTPWFATANHCIPDQATADTASFEWFFQATSCGGNTRDPRYAQTYGGAQLLYADFKLEPSFLKLNQQPPGGVYFIGWDTTIRVGDSVWTVHHPKSDHTMASLGKVTSLLQTEIDTSQGGTHLLDTVDFTYGGIEPGSSGAGLFSVSGGSAHWKGTLFGGPQYDYQMASYSHLQSYYNNIKLWLENASPTANPAISFSASPATVNYLAATTLTWSSAHATACSATTSDGWSGDVALSGSVALAMNLGTTYTLSCIGPGGKATQAVRVAVNPPPPEKIACLLDWAERNYPNLFHPAAATQFSTPYLYRHYLNTRSYAGVSTLDNHVYYLSPAGVLEDEGALSAWLVKSSCG